MQEPGTLLPLFAALASLIHILLLGHILGGRLVVGVLLGVFLFIAVGSFLWRFAFRYADEYAKQSERLMLQEAADAERSGRLALRSLQQRVEIGFSNVGSKGGLSALRALNDGWEQLELALRERRATDPLALGRAAGLARETYERGLSVLDDAVGLMNSAGLTERKRLEWEVTQLTEEVEAGGVDAERQRMRHDTLALHEQRLRLLDQIWLRAEHLVYQAQRCEASLQEMGVEIAAMRFGGAGERIDSVINALSSTIQEVKEVQEELKRFGY